MLCYDDFKRKKSRVPKNRLFFPPAQYAMALYAAQLVFNVILLPAEIQVLQRFQSKFELAC